MVVILKLITKVFSFSMFSTAHSILTYSQYGILACFIFPMILSFIHIEWLNKFLRFFGNMSLELYLTNIFLNSILRPLNTPYIVGEMTLNQNGFLYYAVIILLGIALSILFQRLWKQIWKPKKEIVEK